MMIDRRRFLAGAAAAAGAAMALPAFASPVERYRSTYRLAAMAWPPRTDAEMAAAEPFMFSCRWHYESIGDGWGVIRHTLTGRAWTTIPSERRAAWGCIHSALPIVRDGETGEAVEARSSWPLSRAAAQMATWIEEVGGGVLYVHFPNRDDADNRYLMNVHDAPPLVAVDGSRGDNENFFLFAPAGAQPA